jgi:hypothetical protein
MTDQSNEHAEGRTPGRFPLSKPVISAAAIAAMALAPAAPSIAEQFAGAFEPDETTASQAGDTGPGYITENEPGKVHEGSPGMIEGTSGKIGERGLDASGSIESGLGITESTSGRIGERELDGPPAIHETGPGLIGETGLEDDVTT